MHNYHSLKQHNNAQIANFVHYGKTRMNARLSEPFQKHWLLIMDTEHQHFAPRYKWTRMYAMLISLPSEICSDTGDVRRGSGGHLKDPANPSNSGDLVKFM